MEKIVSSTELQKNTRQIIDWTRINDKPVIIQTYGKSMAVLLSYEDYQRRLQFAVDEKQPTITAAEQAELKQIEELTKSLFADASWEEIEAGREDRWF